MLSAWSTACGSASSWLPQILTLMCYGFAPFDPGAGIPMNSKDSFCLAGSVTLRSPQAGIVPCPPSCLAKHNEPSHPPCLRASVGALARAVWRTGRGSFSWERLKTQSHKCSHIIQSYRKDGKSRLL